MVDGDGKILDYRIRIRDAKRKAVTALNLFNFEVARDAVSEAVMRVVLDRLTKAPPVQLCHFSAAGLSNILVKARDAACSATGSTIAEINNAAYQRVRVNAVVKQAIDDATGIPVSPLTVAGKSAEAFG